MNWTKVGLVVCAMAALIGCGPKRSPMAPEATPQHAGVMGWHQVKTIEEHTPGAPLITHLVAEQRIIGGQKFIEVRAILAPRRRGDQIPTPDAWDAQVFVDRDMNGDPDFVVLGRSVEMVEGGRTVRSFYPDIPENPGGWGNLTGLAAYSYSVEGRIRFLIPYSAMHQPWEPDAFAPPASVELWTASWDENAEYGREVGAEMSMKRTTMASVKGPGPVVIETN